MSRERPSDTRSDETRREVREDETERKIDPTSKILFPRATLQHGRSA